MGDTVAALTINLIDMIGWRGAFQACGAFGFALVIIGVLFVAEPSREDEDRDSERGSAGRLTEKYKKEAPKKSVGFLEGFKILLTNPSAVCIIIGSCFKVMASATMGTYVTKYFEVYQEDFLLFGGLNAMALFIGSLSANITAAIIMSTFDKYIMTKPLISFFKSFLDVPLCALVFLQ